MIFKKYKFDLIGLIFLLIVLIFISHNMFSNAFIGGTNDMEVQAYKMWYLKESLVNYHQIPSWTSDQFGGRPFLLIYQPLTYYLALPFSIIFGGVLTPKIFTFAIYAIALIGFYFLAKYLFKNRLKAVFASLIFLVFPFNLMSTAGGSLAQVAPIMFIPFSFLVYEKLIDKPKLRYFALIGLLLGLSLLTHHAVGGTLFIALLIFVLYDGFIKNKKHAYKLIPFLILGVIISLVFLIPSYMISDTLNFSVVKQSATESFRPLSILRFFSRDSSRGEYLGVIAFISILSCIFCLKRKKYSNLIKYWIASIILLLIGLLLHPLIPGFIKATLERIVRMFSVLSVTLSIIILAGIIELSRYLVSISKKYKLFDFDKYKKSELIFKILFTLILVLLVFLSYTYYMPSEGNELKIPSGVVDFYKEISDDKEYYRIEDQAFAPFGFSPILHKHGILNGGNYLAAPKYHFFFWIMSWDLLKSEPGMYNFANLYGTLAIKYLLFKDKLEIPYLKKIKEEKDYIIYENEKFLDYIRLVPNIVSINAKEPNHIVMFYEIISKNLVPFEKIGFVHSSELKSDINFNRGLNGKVEILEREPGYLKLNLNDTKEKTYLVVAESYHPYWKAKQNMKELKIYEGIPSTLIIPIEKNGVLELKYTPPKIRFILFLLALFIIFSLIGIIIYDIRNERKNK